MEKKTFKLCNVVLYDGSDAYVCKYVLRSKGYDEIDDESKKLIEEELKGNGDILKIDILHEVSLDNIKAFNNAPEYKTVYDRFKKLWF